MKRLFCLALACFLTLAGCSASNSDQPPGQQEQDPIDNLQEIKYAVIPMLMVDGKYYYDTGRESAVTARCGVMDGEITSTVDGTQIPFQDNQSNFGAGYSFQYGENDTIEVLIDDKWCVFEHRSGDGSLIRFEDAWYSQGDLSEETIAWIHWYNGLTTQEQREIDHFPDDLAALLEPPETVKPNETGALDD